MWRGVWARRHALRSFCSSDLLLLLFCRSWGTLIRFVRLDPSGWRRALFHSDQDELAVLEAGYLPVFLQQYVELFPGLLWGCEEHLLYCCPVFAGVEHCASLHPVAEGVGFGPGFGMEDGEACGFEEGAPLGFGVGVTVGVVAGALNGVYEVVEVGVFRYDAVFQGDSAARSEHAGAFANEQVDIGEVVGGDTAGYEIECAAGEGKGFGVGGQVVDVRLTFLGDEAGGACEHGLGEVAGDDPFRGTGDREGGMPSACGYIEGCCGGGDFG
jgi:hypothetical protein